MYNVTMKLRIDTILKNAIVLITNNDVSVSFHLTEKNPCFDMTGEFAVFFRVRSASCPRIMIGISKKYFSYVK